MNKKNLITRLILFFLGMTIIQFGVGLSLVTNIGSDSFTVFTQGLSKVLHSTPGMANMLILFVLTAIILLVDRKRINIGTFICLIGVGPVIDFSIKIFSMLPIDSYNIIIKALLIVLVQFIIAVGFSILSATNLGVAPNDIVPFIIQDKTKFQYRWIRMSLDATYLIVGFLLGGKVWIGTIISMLTIGPFIQLCLPYGTRLVEFIVKTEDKETIGQVIEN
ncbi:membrane protein [Clostridium sp. CTA-5]